MWSIKSCSTAVKHAIFAPVARRQPLIGAVHPPSLFPGQRWGSRVRCPLARVPRPFSTRSLLNFLGWGQQNLRIRRKQAGSRRRLLTLNQTGFKSQSQYKMVISSPPSHTTDTMRGPEDELRAAEAEFSANNPEVEMAAAQETGKEKALEGNSSAAVLHESTDHQPRKKLKLTEADRKRSVRMFGALMGTLSKFHDETSKNKQTDAAKRRAAVESRLQAKLKVESEALHRLRAFEVEEKNLKQQVSRKAEELGHLSELNSIQFANKLAFSNYLRTSTSKSKKADRNDPPLSPQVRPRPQNEPIFWLPYKLLPEQKDLIERQRRLVQEEVEEEQRLWKEQKASKQEELEQLQSSRDARLAEIEVEKARSRAHTEPAPAADTSTHILPEQASENIEPPPAEEISETPPELPEQAGDNDNARDEPVVENEGEPKT
ncbi:hypothetical protein O181_025562 [Austropuccinia psidii MF-1]|uniref:Pinin/SDK/MemA protein domain-containing protein n=1 Tax=Austropuccinia psidii MF-1 TaxID=1389203 RepID=A0A9Q3GZZ7_9BASI|nr:hypothetical protein [Austropuccinia psidii MF-1]